MKIARRLLAEAFGTAALLVIVVGSGIMGSNLADGNVAIALFANSVATGLGLFVLISLLAPVSGAHFNPLVSAIAAFDAEIDGTSLVGYVAAQITAAVVGVWLAHAMFGLPILELGTNARTGIAQWLSELVATLGLVLVVLGSKQRSAERTAAAIGAYIAAAYWFTGSTAFANPAVTIARAVSDTFAGIRPVDVGGFIAAQSIGAGIAVVLSRQLFQRKPTDTSQVTAEIRESVP